MKSKQKNSDKITYSLAGNMLKMLAVALVSFVVLTVSVMTGTYFIVFFAMLLLAIILYLD